MNALREDNSIRVSRRGRARGRIHTSHYPAPTEDPGPQNAKKKRKQQVAKEKAKTRKIVLAEAQINTTVQPLSASLDYENQDEIVYLASRRTSAKPTPGF